MLLKPARLRKMDWADIELGFRLGCTIMLLVWVSTPRRA